MTDNGVASASDQLLERLNDPEVADNLNRLLDRLDLVCFGVESVDGFIRRGEVITESVASAFGEMKGLGNENTAALLEKAPQLVETGTKLAEAAGDMDVDELARSKVLQRLTDPETLALLNQMLDRLPLAAFLLESLEGFIQRGDTIAENVADAVSEMKLSEAKIDPRQINALMKAIPQLRAAGEQLLQSRLLGEGLPKSIDAAESLVESGMLDKQVVDILGELGRKGTDTYHEVTSRPVEPIGGLFATLRPRRTPTCKSRLVSFLLSRRLLQSTWIRIQTKA